MWSEKVKAFDVIKKKKKKDKTLCRAQYIEYYAHAGTIFHL